MTNYKICKSCIMDTSDKGITFDNDAKLASKILGITLTKRANGAASSVPLAGFPFHSLDQPRLNLQTTHAPLHGTNGMSSSQWIEK